MEKIAGYVQKYKYAALILLAGLLLMLWPAHSTSRSGEKPAKEEDYSLEQTQRELESLLESITGVGHVKVMLTLKSGSSLELAQDVSHSDRDTENREETQVVKISGGSGVQQVVVTEETYPVYQGAVVVCEGAENAQVRLHVTEAVAVLTGLSSEKISVVRGIS